MRLKNFLIVVKDIERSKAFYRDLFGLQVTADFGGNVMLTGGLVLQEQKIWESFIQRPVTFKNYDAELYFEENDMDGFLQRLHDYECPTEYVNELMEHSWGQRVIRICDPDGHMIEVGESLDFVARRFLESGMSVEETAEKTQLPVDTVKQIDRCRKED